MVVFDNRGRSPLLQGNLNFAGAHCMREERPGAIENRFPPVLTPLPGPLGKRALPCSTSDIPAGIPGGWEVLAS